MSQSASKSGKGNESKEEEKVGKKYRREDDKRNGCRKRGLRRRYGLRGRKSEKRKEKEETKDTKGLRS